MKPSRARLVVICLSAVVWPMLAHAGFKDGLLMVDPSVKTEFSLV